MRGIRIATRYARSLLILCVERNEADRVFEDMKLLHESMAASRDLRVFLLSPVIKADKKNAVLDKLFGASISKTTLAFISLLTKKGREGMLPEIAASFIDQVKEHKHITTARVSSAIALDDTTRQAIRTKAATLASGTIDLEEVVDPELIGGFILQVGDQQIDTSVLTNLRNLRRDFSENPYIPAI